MKRIFGIALLLLFSSSAVYAQSSSTAHVSVTIMEPVGASRLEDLNFGRFFMEAAPGTVELQASGLRRIKGGVRLFGDDAAQPALLRLTNPNFAFAVTLSSEPVIVKRVGGAESITIGSFTVSVSGGEEVAVTAKTISVGGTLQADAFLQPGLYLPASPLTVIVHYN